MISTAFLTDYNKRLYARGAAHNHLKLFNSLIPGSEIITAEYSETPIDFNISWFDYRYIQESREFINSQSDKEFQILAEKTDSFLELWIVVINKLNFVYRKHCDPFEFNKFPDSELITVLREAANRCEEIIVTNFNKNDYDQAKHDIGRETFYNMFL